MKGEYVEEGTTTTTHQDDNNHQAMPLATHPHPHDIFPKYPPPHSHNLHPHSFLSPPPPTASNKKPKTTPVYTTTPPITSDDGGTVETSRRPRGRPPGSKNRPKPPIIITREPDQPNMSPYILELPPGSDIVDSLTRFTRRRQVGLCVLTASGAVSNLTLKQPSTSPPSAAAAAVTFRGRFDILSLSAVILLEGPTASHDFSFTVSVAGPQGQIVGGKVVGPLVASGVVYVIAASFNAPTYQRLPLEEQEVGGNDSVSRSTEGGGESQCHDGGGASSVSGGPVGMYSCQDVIWAPTPARPHPTPQQQHPSPY